MTSLDQPRPDPARDERALQLEIQLAQARCALDRAEIEVAVAKVSGSVQQWATQGRVLASTASRLASWLLPLRHARRGPSMAGVAQRAFQAAGLPWWLAPVLTPVAGAVASTVLRRLLRPAPMLMAGALGGAVWWLLQPAQPSATVTTADEPNLPPELSPPDPS